MARVLILDTIAEEGLELLRTTPGIEFDVKTGLSGEALRSELAKYDAAICRSGVKITPASLEGNKSLRAIARAGVGVDNIDLPAATRCGIVVMNTPAGNTLSTAEHAFSLLLALSRAIAPAYQTLCQGKWDRKNFMGTQVAGKKIGIIGLGRIGQEVAKRARAFEMEVIGFDPYFSAEQAQKLGIKTVDSIKAILPQVDYLTVHTPLTPETKDLISLETLPLCKPGIRLVNCARGGIYNEAALVEGLKSGQIGGVALDVFENEPCTNSPLFGMPNVVCTPHLGASTEEAQTLVAVEAVQLILKYLTTGEIRHAVNAVALDPTTLKALKGYINIAFRLGSFLSQWHRGAIDGIQLSYRGEIANKDTKILTASFCAGLLSGVVEDVNIVNSVVTCRERGVQINEERNPDFASFSSSMNAEIRVGGVSLSAGGTLFGNEMPRLFRLNEYRLEAYLDGNVMIFSHRDKPGIIGYIGSVLGKHNVNIAQMSVGRASATPGGTAIGVLNLDSNVSAEAIAEILKFDGIDSVHQIRLPGAGEAPSWMRFE